jgi:hypothetical protein
VSFSFCGSDYGSVMDLLGRGFYWQALRAKLLNLGKYVSVKLINSLNLVPNNVYIVQVS